MIEKRRFHIEIYLICTDGINLNTTPAMAKEGLYLVYICPSIHFRVTLVQIQAVDWDYTVDLILGGIKV